MHMTHHVNLGAFSRQASLALYPFYLRDRSFHRPCLCTASCIATCDAIANSAYEKFIAILQKYFENSENNMVKSNIKSGDVTDEIEIPNNMKIITTKKLTVGV